MSDNELYSTFWICLTVCLILLMVVIGYVRIKNAPIERDTAAACVKAGQSWINGDCVPNNTVRVH